MKRYIKSSFYKNKDWMKINWTQDAIVNYLSSGAKVYIESGSANDQILSYSEDPLGDGKELLFTTTGTIFPKQISLYDFSYVDPEDYEGSLFVEVG